MRKTEVPRILASQGWCWWLAQSLGALGASFSLSQPEPPAWMDGSAAHKEEGFPEAARPPVPGVWGWGATSQDVCVGPIPTLLFGGVL